MTAIFYLRQNSAVHLATDASAYDRVTGVLSSVRMPKAIVIQTISVAVACTGPVWNGPAFAMDIADRFDSLDALVADGAELLFDIFDDTASMLYVAGWLKAQDRPAVFVFDRIVTGGKFYEQRGLGGTPLPGEDPLAAAGFEIRDTEDYVADRDLLHLREIARQERVDGHHWVGGKALLTTIDGAGTTQRVLHEWPEDSVGDVITPRPIDDWRAWCAKKGVSQWRKSA